MNETSLSLVERAVIPSLAHDDLEIEVLLRSARDGSKESLNRLLYISRPRLVEWSRFRHGSRLNSKAGESDIAQDALLLAYRHFQQFHGETVGEWFGWLAAISRSAQIALVRRYAPGGKRDLNCESPQMLDPRNPDHGIPREWSPSGESPLADLIREEDLKVIECALQALSPLAREVVVRHHREGESFAEIAVSLGRTKLAVEKLWYRAVRRIAHVAQQSSDCR